RADEPHTSLIQAYSPVRRANKTRQKLQCVRCIRRVSNTYSARIQQTFRKHSARDRRGTPINKGWKLNHLWWGGLPCGEMNAVCWTFVAPVFRSPQPEISRI